MLTVAIALLFAPQAAPAAKVELPEGPAARAFAGVGPDTEPATFDLGGMPLSPSDPAWDRPDVWLEWAQWVRAEAAETYPTPSRRARLCLLAGLQGRADDAWEHFAALGGDPAWCAAVLPLLAPGVAVETYARVGASAGGLPAALPDGIVLEPQLPPPNRPASEIEPGRRPERRHMTLTGLRIGDAVLKMRVALEVEGVQVDFEHVSGGSAHFFVRLPTPAEHETRVEYIDWMRQDESGIAHELHIEPGSQPRIVFGRFRPRSVDWPTRLPERMPEGLVRAGVRIEVGPGDPEQARIESFAAGLGALLAVPVEVHQGPEAEAAGDFAGLRIRLHDDGSRALKLRNMISAAERFALSATQAVACEHVLRPPRTLARGADPPIRRGRDPDLTGAPAQRRLRIPLPARQRFLVPDRLPRARCGAGAAAGARDRQGQRAPCS